MPKIIRILFISILIAAIPIPTLSISGCKDKKKKKKEEIELIIANTDFGCGSWTPTDTGVNCPESRDGHTAIWTGEKMIVWGGGTMSSGATNTGGIYDPETDTWTPTSTGADCPSPREEHTTVWTGSEMIVWGGCDLSTGYVFRSGGIYDPATDTWVATSTGAGCPSPRNVHTALWTGNSMIVWGGLDNSAMWQTNTGAVYDPGTDTWAATSTDPPCPTGRAFHTAIWTGSRMIVWSGWEAFGNDTNIGASYDPVADAWTPISAGAGCPPARMDHTAVWTGTKMIVWGGWELALQVFNTGGIYDPVSDTWTPTTTSTGCLSARVLHATVWTGTQMIVWGGMGWDEIYNTGGLYDPVSDTWTATSFGYGAPSYRYRHTAVWTGTQMIVWGGLVPVFPEVYATNTGGIFMP